ncbi:MAG: methyltransferase domain-containing protein [Cyanobium sp.]
MDRIALTDPGPDAAGGEGVAQDFRERVQRQFGRRAGLYESQACLQRALAWRLGRLGRDLPLPEGPRADLGAGSGLLSRALLAQHRGLADRPPLQLDHCPQLLARNTLPRRLLWDLNEGLPAELNGAALLASGFSLQWLERPAVQLSRWCRCLRPGGWLLLAVPTAGSFPQWRRAAQAAGVPCTALGLPEADALIATVRDGGLELRHNRLLRFSRPRQGGLETLRHLSRLGASASRTPPLSVTELRRLLRHWPAATPLTWEMLVLVGRRAGEACDW